MARPLKLEISESADELKALLRQQKTAQGKERMQALYLLKLRRVKTVSELATVLGRHRVTVQEWLAAYRSSGIKGLLTLKRQPGRQATIPPWAVKALQKRLSDPKGFPSYGAVQQWLSDRLGVDVSYMAVYRLVRGKFKAKLKVGKRQSTEQDPDRLQRFKTELADNLAEYLPHLLSDFQPDLVLYDAGVDPHICDRLGKLALTDTGIFRREMQVLSTCMSIGYPVACVIGGGYADDLKSLVYRHSLLHRAASEVYHQYRL